MCHLANKWLIINGKENLIAEILLVTRMGSNVIPLGFEPKTYCLEGSCSNPTELRNLRFSAAKIQFFIVTTKFLFDYLYLSK